MIRKTVFWWGFSVFLAEYLSQAAVVDISSLSSIVHGLENHHFQIVDRLPTAFIEEDSLILSSSSNEQQQQRQLQTVDAPTDEVCAFTGEEDDTFVALFGKSYQSNCSCSTDGNDYLLQELITEFNETLSNSTLGTTAAAELITTFVQDYNELMGSIYFNSVTNCTNNCEACFQGDTFCGILKSYDQFSYQFAEGSITLQALSRNSADALTNFTLDSMSYTGSRCINYTKSYIGEVCFGVVLTYGGGFLTVDDFDSTDPTDAICFGSYNGMNCNSCDFKDGDLDCIVADCTNVEPNALVDSCNKEGIDGVFVIFDAVLNNDESAFSVGECGDDITISVPKPPSSGGNEIPAPPAPAPGNNQPSDPSTPESESDVSSARICSYFALLTLGLLLQLVWV
jgi:hypothetical protein